MRLNANISPVNWVTNKYLPSGVILMRVGATTFWSKILTPSFGLTETYPIPSKISSLETKEEGEGMGVGEGAILEIGCLKTKTAVMKIPIAMSRGSFLTVMIVANK